jgi:hypothetical protein
MVSVASNAKNNCFFMCFAVVDDFEIWFRNSLMKMFEQFLSVGGSCFVP